MMIRLVSSILAFSALGTPEALPAAETSQTRFDEAMELIQAFSGAGDELSRAMAVAEDLSESDPTSGFSQVLYAEALSTWRLGQDGEPAGLRLQIIDLANDALRLNPNLAQAHVAKARAYVRASMLDDATAEVAEALSLDPKLSGAMFLRAEIYRRSGDLVNGEEWYRRFIAATPHPARKSNGFYWLGSMFQDAAYRDPQQRAALDSKAREAYERMVELDPNGPWKAVNFAIFLNDYVADFDAAERYAQRALDLMEFPMARYHLAAARYQRLWSKISDLDEQALWSSAVEIESATDVSLDQAISFRSFSGVVRRRLVDLRSRMQAPER